MEKTYKKGWVSVCIPFKDGQSIDTIFNLADKLQEDKGITFDTGSTGKFMDWELDWSLKGAKPKDVLKFLDENNIDYETRKVEDQAGD